MLGKIKRFDDLEALKLSLSTTFSIFSGCSTWQSYLGRLAAPSKTLADLIEVGSQKVGYIMNDDSVQIINAIPSIETFFTLNPWRLKWDIQTKTVPFTKADTNDFQIDQEASSQLDSGTVDVLSSEI